MEIDERTEGNGVCSAGEIDCVRKLCKLYNVSYSLLKVGPATYELRADAKDQTICQKILRVSKATIQ